MLSSQFYFITVCVCVCVCGELHVTTLKCLNIKTTHFRPDGTGSLLKLRGAGMDWSLFMDTQLGTGDGGLWVGRLQTQGDTRNQSTYNNFSVE